MDSTPKIWSYRVRFRITDYKLENRGTTCFRETAFNRVDN